MSPSRTISLGKAWAGNSTNVTPYRHSGLVTVGHRQLLSYYNDNGALTFSERSLVGGAVTQKTVEGVSAPVDAHFSSSIGVDRDGRIHVLAGAHVSKAICLRSDTESVETVKRVADPVLEKFDITYPAFVTDRRANFHVVFRVGSAARSAWRTLQWDGAWLEKKGYPLLSGITEPWSAGPYINTPLADTGQGFGLFVVWRTAAIFGSRQRAMNGGIDYLEADLVTKRLRTWSGAVLPIPATQAVMERVAAVPWTASLCNQAGATRLADGRPVGVFYWTHKGRTTVNMLYPDSHGWQLREIAELGTPIDLVGRGTLSLPYSRPVCVTLPDGSVFIIYRTMEAGRALVGHRLHPPDFEKAEVLTLIEEPLGYYEPVVDGLRAQRDGILSLYVQKCHSGIDGKAEFMSSEAYLAEWDFQVSKKGTLSV
ncbi:BNR-4 repeat-containing protein [Reyranella sp.]|uniref:BNR-4 repeat-containing protein n=1 Tax=Reyranella sp. TaxID=1929291 RepID=UPI003D0ADC5C